MITITLLIFSILQIVNLGGMIAIINTTKTIILIIAIITTKIVISYGKKSVIFVAKKIVALINIQTMSNEK